MRNYENRVFLFCDWFFCYKNEFQDWLKTAISHVLSIYLFFKFINFKRLTWELMKIEFYFFFLLNFLKWMSSLTKKRNFARSIYLFILQIHWFRTRLTWEKMKIELLKCNSIKKLIKRSHDQISLLQSYNYCRNGNYVKCRRYFIMILISYNACNEEKYHACMMF